MNLLKRLILCTGMMAALSCGEQNKMLELATMGEGLVGKHIYVFATNPPLPNYDVFLLIADGQTQLYQSFVVNTSNAFGNFHVSNYGIALMGFTINLYVNIPPYTLPWTLTSGGPTPTSAFFISNENGIYAINPNATALLYRYDIEWSLIGGTFSNSTVIQAVDYPEGSDFIYTVEQGGLLQRYSSESGFETLYAPTYTPAIGGTVNFIHRGKSSVYVGTTSRLYFCGNPTGNGSEQYNRLGSDINPTQTATSYCVLSDESRIFASTTETAFPFTMHLYIRNGGGWSELLSFAGAAVGDVMKLFDMGEGKLVLWIDTTAASAGIYVFDYKKMKFNRVSINPAYTIQSVVVK